MVPLNVRVSVWFRLLLLQAGWSYRRMQTVGWLLAARPIVRWKHQAGEARVLDQLVVHFNTHSLLAPLLIGAALREVVDGNDPELAKGHLVRWMGTFGALGDMVYWQAMMWNLSWLAVVAWLLGGAGGVAVLAAAWILIEISIRILLFELGFRNPARIAEWTRRLAPPSIRRRFNTLGTYGMAFAAGAAFALGQPGASGPWLDVAATFGAIAAVPIAVRTRFRSIVFILPVTAAILAGLLV